MRDKISTCVCSPFFLNKRSYFCVMSLQNTEGIKQRDHTTHPFGRGIGLKAPAQPPRGARSHWGAVPCGGSGGWAVQRGTGLDASRTAFCFSTKCNVNKFKAQGLLDRLHKEEKVTFFRGLPDSASPYNHLIQNFSFKYEITPWRIFTKGKKAQKFFSSLHASLPEIENSVFEKLPFL